MSITTRLVTRLLTCKNRGCYDFEYSPKPLTTKGRSGKGLDAPGIHYSIIDTDITLYLI